MNVKTMQKNVNTFPCEMKVCESQRKSFIKFASWNLWLPPFGIHEEPWMNVYKGDQISFNVSDH
jgi:hypothetical protein